MSTGTQTEVVMPQMGVSVSEGTVTKWLRQVGEAIGRDEPLLEISTDKVDTEVPSPAEGVVTQILVQEGETVEVGTVLATDRAAPAPRSLRLLPPSRARSAAPAPAPEPAGARRHPSPSRHPRRRSRARAAGSAGRGRPAAGNGKTFVSPVVARIAAEHGIDPSVRPGTGTGGRVTKKDILTFIESGAAAARRPLRSRPGSRARAASCTRAGGRSPSPLPAPAAPPPSPRRQRPRPWPPPRRAGCAAPAPPRAAPAPPAPGSGACGSPRAAELVAGEALEPMTAMRRGVMEHMRRSVDTAAHVTSAIEVDLARVVALRQKLKPELAAQKVNLTYLAFIARAAVDTLLDYPWVNGELRGQSIVTRPFVNLGIAVALDEGKGLIVPVIRNAQDLNLTGTARAIQDLAERARTKKLLPDDVQGGTFTITNPGSFGTFHGTPIINQPQSAILGTYALVKRPWVVQDELGSDVIAIRPIMNLTLTYDHRLVDGAYAGMYLRDLRDRLQSWDEAAY